MFHDSPADMKGVGAVAWSLEDVDLTGVSRYMLDAVPAFPLPFASLDILLKEEQTCGLELWIESRDDI